MLDPELLKQAKTERDKLVDLQHDVERARSDYHHSIRRLHGAGASLREIADELGLSHQRVHQIVDVSGESSPTGVPQPMIPPFFTRRGRRKGGGRSGPFTRFTDPARQVVVDAQEEARGLGHNYIGTEHLLLGLLRGGQTPACRALDALGVTAEAARSQIERVVGRGEELPPGRIPFTPRAKKVLELSLHEALALGHKNIGTEHLLLGLARETEGVGAQTLLALGVGEEKIRAEVERQLAA
jgi:hypothetical protein